MTPQEVRSLFDYDAASGALRWKQNRGRNKTAGQIAGTRRRDGYCAVKIVGHNYLVHRLAWAWTYGEWPMLLDHIDMDPSNNRLANLRAATHSQNKANRGATISNTSGFKGVTLDKTLKVKPWKAAIKFNSKMINLGTFATPEEAHAAYAAKATALFGDFARAA